MRLNLNIKIIFSSFFFIHIHICDTYLSPHTQFTVHSSGPIMCVRKIFVYLSDIPATFSNGNCEIKKIAFSKYLKQIKWFFFFFLVSFLFLSIDDLCHIGLWDYLIYETTDDRHIPSDLSHINAVSVLPHRSSFNWGREDTYHCYSNNMTDLC